VKVKGVVVKVGAVVVEEEEALGGDVERGGRADEGALSGCAGAGAGAWVGGRDTRASFLRSRQGLSSASESLRRRFERAHGCSGGVNADSDADADADAVSWSDVKREVSAWKIAPVAGGGSSVCRRCSAGVGDGERGGELRGDDGAYASCGGLDGVLCSSSSGVSADDAAREYGSGTAIVSRSAVSGSRLSDCGADGAGAGGDGTNGLSGRESWSFRAPFGSSAMGDRSYGRRGCEIEDVNQQTTVNAPHADLLTLVISRWRKTR
jgi:hypothetical protein